MIAAEPSTRTKEGWGELEVELVNGQSAAITAEAHNPIKLLVPRGRGASVWAYLSNFGGGLLPGDSIDFSLKVGRGGACFFGTQSSTKIYRAGPEGVVTNHFRGQVESGGKLVYAPDVAQSFAASRYRQRQILELQDESAALVFLDWYSSGRVARGERWDFSEYGSRTEIRLGKRLIFLDALHLEDGLIDLPARMGRINCIATLVVIGREAPAVTEEFVRRPEVLTVSSPIPGGVVLRFAGESVELVARAVYSKLGFVAEWLGDNPFARKW